MATTLKKSLTRVLDQYPGLVITLTPDGMNIRKKGKRQVLEASWDVLFGAMAMRGDNATTLAAASKTTLTTLGIEGADA